MARKKPADGAAAEGMKTYQVLRNLHHDGEQYEPNRVDVLTIALDDDDAKPLLEAGVIQAMPGEAV